MKDEKIKEYMKDEDALMNTIIIIIIIILYYDINGYY